MQILTNQSTILNALEEVGSDLNDFNVDADWFQHTEEIDFDQQEHTDTESNAIEMDLTDTA